MPRPHHSTRAETRWAVRIIPLFIVAVLGVATYSVVARLCSKLDTYLDRPESLEMVDEKPKNANQNRLFQSATCTTRNTRPALSRRSSSSIFYSFY